VSANRVVLRLKKAKRREASSQLVKEITLTSTYRTEACEGAAIARAMAFRSDMAECTGILRMLISNRCVTCSHEEKS
jgi:hypothetical protein